MHSTNGARPQCPAMINLQAIGYETGFTKLLLAKISAETSTLIADGVTFNDVYTMDMCCGDAEAFHIGLVLAV